MRRRYPITRCVTRIACVKYSPYIPQPCCRPTLLLPNLAQHLQIFGPQQEASSCVPRSSYQSPLLVGTRFRRGSDEHPRRDLASAGVERRFGTTRNDHCRLRHYNPCCYCYAGPAAAPSWMRRGLPHNWVLQTRRRRTCPRKPHRLDRHTRHAR